MNLQLNICFLTVINLAACYVTLCLASFSVKQYVKVMYERYKKWYEGAPHITIFLANKMYICLYNNDIANPLDLLTTFYSVFIQVLEVTDLTTVTSITT